MSADVTTRAAVKTIALFTHTHPEQTAPALRETVEIATKHGATVFAPPEERESTATTPVAAGRPRKSPRSPTSAWSSAGTARSSTRFASTPEPACRCSLINFGTVGFLAAVERDELVPGLERALAGDFETVSLPGLDGRRRH